MKNLLLSSLLLLFLSACKFGHYGSMVTPVPASNDTLVPIFDNNFNSFLFKTNIRVYGKEFSGLLVTKQLQQNDYRVVFTTELGMKLFDFEFKDTSFTLHHCVPQFNRPALLRTIQKDIQILLMSSVKQNKLNVLEDKKHQYVVFKTKDEGLFDYYFVEKKSKKITRIEHSKKRIKKTTFTLSNYDGQVPGMVLIKHHDIKLQIELNLLKK